MPGAAEWTVDPAAIPVSAGASSMTEAEFLDFYHGTARGLKAYLLRLCAEPSQADDLLQEAYFRLLRAELPAMDNVQRRNYLFRIATNLARDQFRRSRFEPSAIEDHPTPCSASADPGLAADVARLLAQSPPRDRELVWLAYVEGASHREIAQITGLKEASIRPMLYRARQKLAALLRQHGWSAPPEGSSR